MKKSGILVGVFAMVIATALLASANEFNVDFDRGALRSADFVDAVKMFDVPNTDNAVSMKSGSPKAVDTISMVVYRLTSPGLQKLRKEIVNMPGLSAEFIQLINEDKTVVLYNDKSVFLTAKAGGNDYYTFLKSNDKKLIEFLSEQKTAGPQAGIQNKHWVTKCVPYVKTLWQWIQGVWTAYEVTEFLCTQEWEGDPLPPISNTGGGGGSLPHTVPANHPERK